VNKFAPPEENLLTTAVPGVIWPKDRAVESPDGATITYTFLGPPGGRVVALCSGFLCPDTWWYFLAPALARAGHRVLLFHYRGIATSTLPRSTSAEAFTVDRFAGDLRAIVEHEDLDGIVLVGHSMGVQVMLDAYRQLAERTAAIVALTGPYASPVHTLYGRREVVYLYEAVRLLLRSTFPPLLRAGWKASWQHLPFLAIGRAVRAFGPRTSTAIVQSYVDHAAAMDPRLVLRIAEGMHGHDAMDILGEVAVPALVVIGGRDPFSPPQLGHDMAAAMPQATLRTIANGTHGTILEYPEQVNGYVLDFLADLVERAA
jgi:pimeloyl-ACP methyl ester carboxylesterase